MRKFLNQRSLLRFSLILLFAALGVVAYSWWSAKSHPSEAMSLDVSDFSGVVFRAGTSTQTYIEDLQARLKANPRDWRSYSQLGLAYLQKARETGDPAFYQKAEGVFQKALGFTPDDYTALSGMGALELARHQFLEGLKWGERARQINPDSTYAYGVMADAQIELGRYSEGADTLQAMVDLRPDLSSYSRISYIRELNGDTDGAIEMMQWAVDSGGPNAENTAWTRTQLGNLYFNLGRIDQAEVEYQRTLEAKPGYVYALAGLGRVRMAQGQTDQAIELLTQASQAIPIPEFVIALGEIYEAAGQPAAAQKQFDLVHVIQQLYEANGVDLDVEIALFNADHGHDIAATVEQARQAYKRRPSIFAADVVAWALYQAGDYQEAESFSQQALRLGTKDALKFFHAGMISYRLGKFAQAREYLQQALATNPNFSVLYQAEARRTLEELQTASSKK